MNTARTSPYGHWPSPLEADSLFRGSESISFLRPGRHGLFFLLSKPDEGNALVLMHLSPDGYCDRVTPPGINVRSRVHEYGGLSFAISDEAVYYCQFDDQRVYRLAYDQQSRQAGTPRALTPPQPGSTLRYADFIVDPAHDRLICVREDHRGTGQVINSLVALHMEMEAPGEPLYTDSDFVSSPRLSPDGHHLVFQCWDHPDMPWDNTRLQLARLDASGKLQALRQIQGPRPGALVQPLFHPDGDLYFLADWSDWWNLYRIPRTALDSDGAAEAVCPLAAESCPPQWQLGQRHVAFLDQRRVALATLRDCRWQLNLLDVETGRLETLLKDLGSLDDLSCRGGEILFTAATGEAPAALYRLPADSGHSDPPTPLFRPRSDVELPGTRVSRPQHISFPTEAGEAAHGLYYAPRSPDCSGPDGTLPPLLVSVHGGPTSSARTAFNPALQFWTSRGFAVLDVNHRGSSGYGRRFRQRLYGHWGEVDVADILSGVAHLVDTGRVNPQAVFIRGGSAGGYAVLAALVAGELFRGGCSYYGVSDLSLLARDTHKFESRYLDQLIGPWPEAEALYRARSPIHHIDRIHAPVLLLQGSEDRVVPPNQARGIHDALRARLPDTRLLLFEGEGHGFRNPANQIQALEAERSFYLSLMRVGQDGELPEP